MRLETLLAGAALIASAAADLRYRLESAGVYTLFPGDQDFQRYATPFNLRLTYKPAAVAFPNSPRQVAEAIRAAVAENVYVNARSGGHSYTAYGFGGEDGHLIIDLKDLAATTVDPATKIAKVEAGARLGDMAISLFQQGERALPHGHCPYIGIGGHASFGGWGWPSRAWGLTVDNIVAVELATANGTLLTVSANSNPELFWGLRGAATSLGIVTAFHFKTHAAPAKASMYNYLWANLTATQLTNFLSTWQDFTLTENLPAEFGVTVMVMKGGKNGTVNVNFNGGYYGSLSDPRSVIQKWLSRQPAPQVQQVNTTGWLDYLTGVSVGTGQPKLTSNDFDLTSEHNTFYAKSLTSGPISPKGWKAFSDYAANQGSKTTTTAFVQVELWGGRNSAITSVPRGATAFADAARTHHAFQFYASAPNGQPPYPANGFAFLDGFVQSIVANEPAGWPYGAYANYVDDRLSTQQWQKQYYGNGYARLSKLKAQLDPQNVFKFPQAIQPSSAGRPVAM